MNSISSFFQQYPELSIFLTLALGFWVGSLKFKGFSLGHVTGVLLMGVIVGQMDITISPTVKAVFFLMFLFAVGYGVGPQFIRGLKKDGLPQVLFALIICIFCLIIPWIAAKVLNYDMGTGAGLLSGANTISAVIGVATDTINQLNLSPQQKTTFINNIPVAYAVTYIFGTAGTAWFLAALAPKILGGNLVEESKQLESKMDSGSSSEPGVVSAYRPVAFRAYKISSDWFGNEKKSVEDFENYLNEKGFDVFVERIRQDGQILLDLSPSTLIKQGDVAALSGQFSFMTGIETLIGTEVDDEELLNFPVEILNIMIINKKYIGQTLGDIEMSNTLHGIGIRKLSRAGIELPLSRTVKIDKGDYIELIGPKKFVESAAKELGYADRPTNETDIIFMSIGIVIGGIVGAYTITFGNVPISLSTSGGALIAGLIMGWLRTLHPTFGRIPSPALWILNNLGLNTFIAVVGISAGPSFIAGLKEIGVSLFFAGVVVSLLPMLLGVLIGKYIFKFPLPINLGANAGARTTTAALGQIQEAAQSKVPALGYTVTYAVGNTLMIIWGVVIVMLLS